MCSLETEETHLASMALARSTDITIGKVSLFDISWQDVLIPMFADFLSIKDLFNFRCCSQTAKRIVDAVFERRKNINLAGINSRNIELAFAVLGKRCKRIESLNLARCHWLADDLLLPVLAANKRLRVVNLNECGKNTPIALQPIINECKELRILKLSTCQWLPKKSKDVLSMYHSNLVEFDISYCFIIGERSLIKIFSKLNNLKILSLECTPSVTDEVLLQIANNCHGLEYINLVGCTAISDYGIHAIASNCNQLLSLFVRRCPRVTEHSLAPLRKRLYIDREIEVFSYLNVFYPTDFLVY
ncbi:F-box/LRR-repeat protein 15 [Ceratitis capitata]|uniref:F-box/LRR-repeat protein 15 n=1 Tax=Ceratitis capitata TaxID=7213 RepID=UPI00032A2FB7|nr:F-box/LRR-repeat protein 15 [Ceratitis capitata]